MSGILQNRHFRRLLIGRVVTNLGDSLYFVAAMWLVHDLTGNSFFTGLAGFLTLLPGMLKFLAGPLVDEWSIPRILVGTQIAQAVLVLTIPIAHFYGVLTVGVVLVVMPILASLNEFANPAMVTALPRLLDDDELVAANSVFSVANQGTDMIGYGVSGLLIGFTGVIALFGFDAVTFALAAALFATVVIPSAGASESETDSDSTEDSSDVTTTDDGPADDGPADDGPTDDAPYLDRLRHGLSYIRGTFLAWLLVGPAIVNFAAGAALAVMPAYADTLQVPAMLASISGAGAYGVLMSAFATGTFLGAIAANALDNHPFGWTMVVGLTASGICWTAAIAVDWLPITALLLTLAFVPIGVINVQIAALIQSAPPDELVGRVSSVLGSVTIATLPLGSLVGGAVASAVGAQNMMFAVGISLVAMTAYVLALPGLRNLPRIEQVSI